MTRIRFASPAKAELREALLWYKERGSNLPLELLAEVRRQLTLIREWPRSCAEIPGAWDPPAPRRAVCRRFPYLLIFRERDNEIVILAVAHTSRLPAYWLDRGSR